MLTLYYSPGACSLGPHVLLEELGIECRYQLVSIAARQNQSGEFLSINPRGFVPALAVDGQVATEGPALMAYIASLRPDSGVIPPQGTYARARCFEWLSWLSSSLHVAYAQFWRPERFLVPESEEAGFKRNGRTLVIRKNAEVEERIADPWALGESFGVVDCYLLAFYRWGIRIGLAMEDLYPRWTTWKGMMLARPSVMRTLAHEGIDAPWFPA